MVKAVATQKNEQTDAEQLARKWIAELDMSDSWQREYLDRCKRIIQRYKNDIRAVNGATVSDLRRFAVLWSNIQTLGPAIYARTPNPVVSRRYRDADPVGRQAAEVLERSLGFSLDQYDFDARMEESRDDYLLVGRGQVWVRYVPHIAPGTQPEPNEGPQVSNSTEGEGAADLITYQEVLCDHVSYNDWGMQPCRTWDETGYVWRIVYMTRPELVARFGKIGNDVPLDYSPRTETPGDAQAKERAKKAAVYEIWDKTSGTVIWVCKSYPTAPLDVVPDPLGLVDFFPCPRPIMSTVAQDAYIPIPDYVYYQDQAEEIDELTQRIGTLTDALKMVGIYASEYSTALSNMFGSSNNTMVPIESMALLAEKGGLKGVVEWFPVNMVIETLEGCFNTRKQIMADIYEITGISDILRGGGDPSETATGVGIKAQWGSLRVRDRQRDIERFARDILRIKAQIIASKFTIDTLSAMTDVKLLTDQQKQQIQIAQKLDERAQAQFQMGQQIQAQAAQQAQMQAQQTGQPVGMPPPQQQAQPPQSILQNLVTTGQIPPDFASMMAKPSWEEVDGLLKNNAMRSFRVEVETDSTIAADQQADKAARIEFVTAIGQLMAQSIPLVQQIPAMAPLVAETVKFVARGYHVGAEMEDVIDTTFEQMAKMPPQQPPGQSGQGSGPNVQIEQAKLQAGQQQAQTSAQIDAAKIQSSNQQDQLNAQVTQQKLALEQQQLQHDQQMDQADVALRAQQLQTEQQRTDTMRQSSAGDLELRFMEHRQRADEARRPMIGPAGGVG